MNKKELQVALETFSISLKAGIKLKEVFQEGDLTDYIIRITAKLNKKFNTVTYEFNDVDSTEITEDDYTVIVSGIKVVADESSVRHFRDIVLDYGVINKDGTDTEIFYFKKEASKEKWSAH